jgi:hypothetical protein
MQNVTMENPSGNSAKPQAAIPLRNQARIKYKKFPFFFLTREDILR